MKVVEALLQIPELDVNAVDSKGRSALHLCAIYDDIEAMTKLLARKDIKVNASATSRGVTGTTPLHLAYQYAHNPELFKALLKDKRIDVKAVDGQGMTPRDYLKPSQKRRLASQKAEEAIKSSFASTTKRRKRI